MRRFIPGETQEAEPRKRYQYLNSWQTDGSRVYRLVADTSKRRRPPGARQSQPILAEIGDKLDDIHRAAGPEGTFSHFGSIIGIDLGRVCAAAAFALPSDPTESAAQVKIKGPFLYGRHRRNQRWQEERKAKEGFLEDGLAAHSKRGVGLQSYIDWIRAWQTNKQLTKIPDFYNSPAVAHRNWDSKISQASALDRAAEMIERLPGPQAGNDRRRQERSRPIKPSLFVIGDGKFSTNGLSMAPSLHNKLASRIVCRAQARKSGDLCYKIDEYRSSQLCPRCFGKLQYLKRKPRSRAEALRKGTDGDGLVQDYRVQYCQSLSCKLYLHRDCASAQCFTVSADALLKTGRRPVCFQQQ